LSCFCVCLIFVFRALFGPLRFLGFFGFQSLKSKKRRNIFRISLLCTSRFFLLCIHTIQLTISESSSNFIPTPLSPPLSVHTFISFSLDPDRQTSKFSPSIQFDLSYLLHYHSNDIDHPSLIATFFSIFSLIFEDTGLKVPEINSSNSNPIIAIFSLDCITIHSNTYTYTQKHVETINTSNFNCIFIPW
jgi:hypothetical protein